MRPNQKATLTEWRWNNHYPATRPRADHPRQVTLRKQLINVSRQGVGYFQLPDSKLAAIEHANKNPS